MAYVITAQGDSILCLEVKVYIEYHLQANFSRYSVFRASGKRELLPQGNLQMRPQAKWPPAIVALPLHAPPRTKGWSWIPKPGARNDQAKKLTSTTYYRPLATKAQEHRPADITANNKIHKEVFLAMATTSVQRSQEVHVEEDTFMVTCTDVLVQHAVKVKVRQSGRRSIALLANVPSHPPSGVGQTSRIGSLTFLTIVSRSNAQPATSNGRDLDEMGEASAIAVLCCVHRCSAPSHGDMAHRRAQMSTV